MATGVPGSLPGTTHVTMSKNPVSLSAMVPSMEYGPFGTMVSAPQVGVEYDLVTSLVNGIMVDRAMSSLKILEKLSLSALAAWKNPW